MVRVLVDEVERVENAIAKHSSAAETMASAVDAELKRRRRRLAAA
jgi:hypothetical protein